MWQIAGVVQLDTRLLDGRSNEECGALVISMREAGS
jgi:hypothetical protein